MTAVRAVPFLRETLFGALRSTPCAFRGAPRGRLNPITASAGVAGLGTDFNGAAASGQGVAGVGEQIQEHLVQMGGVGENGARGLLLLGDVDARRQRAAEEVQRLVDQQHD